MKNEFRASRGAFHELLPALRERAASGNPILAGIAGTGAYAQSLAAQLALLPGIRIALLADRRLERALELLFMLGTSRDAVRVIDSGAVPRVSASDVRPLVLTEARAAAGAGLDVLVDCTGDIDTRFELASAALEAGTHVVMVNAETDAAAGVELNGVARRYDRVYTPADGDQPAAIAGLYHYRRSIGFEVVAAGKWERTFSAEEGESVLAGKTNFGPADVAYVDGSKNQLELVSAANATGSLPDKTGLHGPCCAFAELTNLLTSRQDGGLLSAPGCIDYVRQPVGETGFPGAFSR